MSDKEKKTESQSDKPLLFGEDFEDEIERFNPHNHRGPADPSRIEGYSEIVQANDVEKADDLIFREQNQGRTKEDTYRQIGAHPTDLPVEFKWLPVSGPTGEGSTHAARQLDRYKTQEGFRLATEDDLERFGYSLSPTAWTEGGMIRRGPDVALYVRSGEVARMWEQYAAEEAAKAEGAAMSETLTAGEYAAPTFSEEEKEKAHIAH